MSQDDLIARLQRTAIGACLVMAALAIAATRDWIAGAAVLGGGLLAAISFLSIRGGLERVGDGRKAGFALLKLAGRYALLGFLAYVMIARLRLPPLGLIAGASSIVAAAGFEAMRLARKKT